MKNRLRPRRLLQVLFLLCVLTLLPTLGAEAAKKPTCAKTQTVYFYEEAGSQGLTSSTRYIYIKNLASNAKITGIKSSNKKLNVDSYYKGLGTNLKGIGIWFLDEGDVKSGEKAKISFKVKQGGKTYSLSCTVTFKKMPSPVKTLKLGSKNYAKSFKGTTEVKAAYTGKTAEITVKAASGYKIDAIYAVYKSGSEKKKKSGTTISTTNLREIRIKYHVTTKPKNYQKPAQWIGEEKSPLYGQISLYVNYDPYSDDE